MVDARIVEFRQSQRVTPDGQLQQVMIPVVETPAISGLLEVEEIPIDEFSREVAVQRTQDFVQQLISEDATVTVTLPDQQ